MSDTAPNTEATADALALEMRERLPKIVKDLREMSEKIIPDIERCRSMLEAEGNYKAAARISLDLLPYTATKMKEVAELADRAMPVQLNITLMTSKGTESQRDHIERHGLYEYILPTGQLLTLDAVTQLMSDYELVTGKTWTPRKTFADSK
ncbi:hypothetical protein FX264_21820 [Salmonella enterica]|nr:hypothetical protein [Salmonella enterica]